MSIQLYKNLLSSSRTDELVYLGFVYFGELVNVDADEDTIRITLQPKSKNLKVTFPCVRPYFDAEYLTGLDKCSNVMYSISSDANNLIVLHLYTKLGVVVNSLTDSKNISFFVQKIFNNVKSFQIDGKSREAFGLERFYRELKDFVNSQKNDTTENNDAPLQVEKLNPTLRPYQIEAVKWMIKREHVESQMIPDPTFCKLECPKGEVIYYNCAYGYFTTTQPKIATNVRGGVLADEMGLGKTVEVLALIMNNPRIVNEEKLSNVANVTSVEETSDDDIPLASLESQKKVLKKPRRTKRILSSESESEIEAKKTKLEAATVLENLNTDDVTENNLQPVSEERIAPLIIQKLKKDSPDETVEDVEVRSVEPIRILKLNKTNANEDSDIEMEIEDVQETKKKAPKRTKKKKAKPKKKTKTPVKKQETTKAISSIYNTFVKKKTSEIKQNAFAWYETKLAEVNSSPYKFREKAANLTVEVQCLCGDPDIGGNDTVKCCECKNRQHTKCVSFGSDCGSGKYCCPQCWDKKEPHKSNATLIVSPASISRQWIDEIKKHVKKNKLRLLVYRGIHNGGYTYPTKLATKYDVVITTYNVLRQEVKFVVDEESGSSYRLRNAKRYHAPTTPLINVEWWRICLDEAQAVDCTTTMVSEMARRIPAVNRWCVSGTPAQKEVSDLFGLIQFLDVQPYTDKRVWNEVLYQPYLQDSPTGLLSLFSEIMWRTCKCDVEDQIDIPKQMETIDILEFSPIENYFYKKEHELCWKLFLDLLQRRHVELDVTLDKIDRHELTKVLNPLLSLRQACVHPHAVRGRYLTQNNNLMTIENLLDALIAKNVVECEDSLRAYVSSLNGIAGINMLQEDWLDAAENYRSVLRLVEEYKSSKSLHVDTLPHIHALYNLNELLNHVKTHVRNCKIPPTLRDDQLLDQVTELEKFYTRKHISAITQASEEYQKTVKLCEKIEKDVGTKMEESLGWLMDALEWLDTSRFNEVIIQKIRTAILDHSDHTRHFTRNTIINKCTSVWSIKYEMANWWEKVVNLSRLLRDEFTNVREQKLQANGTFSPQLIDEVSACHLRKPKKNNSRKKNHVVCFMCKIEHDMLQLEGLIFLVKEKNKSNRLDRDKKELDALKIDSDDELDVENVADNKKNDDNEDEINLKGPRLEGSWKPSQHEVVINIVHSMAASKMKKKKELINIGQNFLKMCEYLKKEFKEMRALWTHYGDLIASYDEVSMCKQRLRFRGPYEEINYRKPKKQDDLSYEQRNLYEFIDVIEPGMVDEQLRLLDQQKISESADLKRKLGTLRYLETLRNQRYAGQKPEPCPICQNELTDNWCILKCGHSFCQPCVYKLLEHFYTGETFDCSVCRESMTSQDLTYIKFKQDSESTPENQINLKGSFSTKVEAIVRCVLKLRLDDPKVKVLIFSSWLKVLQVIAKALKENRVIFKHLQQPNQVKLIEDFKQSPDTTALLLQIAHGSKGLNLIEATHIILVEPLMNTSEELQAIGRIHRIGQTKPTFVHKFLIKNTIEESIQQAICLNSKAFDKKETTLAKLLTLFDSDTVKLPSRENDLDLSYSEGSDEDDDYYSPEEYYYSQGTVRLQDSAEDVEVDVEG